MERLTTNKDVSEMSMIELAHNSCYIKNGKARYRDFNKDWDTRDFVRDILLESCVLNDEDIEIQDDHAFDETLLDYLQYGHRTIGGLIGLLYRNLWAMADLREKLKEYEDLEEQGLMLRLPCKKMDIVYDVVLCNDGKYHMFEMMVCAINPFGGIRKGTVWNVYLECVDDCSKAYRSFYDFGKTVFLTKEQAEQKYRFELVESEG